MIFVLPFLAESFIATSDANGLDGRGMKGPRRDELSIVERQLFQFICMVLIVGGLIWVGYNVSQALEH